MFIEQNAENQKMFAAEAIPLAPTTEGILKDMGNLDEVRTFIRNYTGIMRGQQNDSRAVTDAEVRRRGNWMLCDFRTGNNMVEYIAIKLGCKGLLFIRSDSEDVLEYVLDHTLHVSQEQE